MASLAASAFRIALAASGLVLNGPDRARAACRVDGPTADVAAVLDDLEIALDDGRVLRLAGIDPPRGTADRPQLAQSAKAYLDGLVGGRRIVVQPLAATADRWERVPALVALAEPASSEGAAPPRSGESPTIAGSTADVSAPASINRALIEAGWARARPEDRLQDCWAGLLVAENLARAGGLGLWADPYYAIVNAQDLAGLALRTGAMAIVQGVFRLRRDRIRSVVSLAPPDRRGVVAVVTRSAEKRLVKSGVDLQKLVGREVRIRGFLDDRFGPRIDFVGAGQIESTAQLDESRSAASPSGSGGPDRNR